MLRVWFGHDYPGKYYKFATGIISLELTTKDFTDQLIRDMAKDIDDVQIDEDGRMWHPIFGAVNQSKLSNGLSQLILLYKFDVVGDITHMGDNCIPWLFKIAENKDVTCVCNRVPVMMEDVTFYDIKGDKVYHTIERLGALAFASILEETQARKDRERCQGSN